jgi:hypothetical protein
MPRSWSHSTPTIFRPSPPSPTILRWFTPDDFLLDQLDLYPGITVAALRDQAGGYRSPPMTIEELLGRLAAAGVPRFASEARRHP